MNAYQISYQEQYGTISPDSKPAMHTKAEVVVSKDITAAMKKLNEKFKVEEKDIISISKLNSI